MPLVALQSSFRSLYFWPIVRNWRSKRKPHWEILTGVRSVTTYSTCGITKAVSVLKKRGLLFYYYNLTRINVAHVLSVVNSRWQCARIKRGRSRKRCYSMKSNIDLMLILMKNASVLYKKNLNPFILYFKLILFNIMLFMLKWHDCQ